MAWSLSFLLLVISVYSVNAQALPSMDDSTYAISPIDVSNDSVRMDMQKQKKLIALQMADAEVIYFIIRVPDDKFGYTIFIDGQLYIEQKTIPAVSGNAGFISEKDSENVAKLVIEKIKEGEMPPTISVDDLMSLNIEY